MKTMILRLSSDIAIQEEYTDLYSYKIKDVDENITKEEEYLLRRELFLKMLSEKPNHNIKLNYIFDTNLTNLNLDMMAFEQCEISELDLDNSTIKNSYFIMRQRSLHTNLKGKYSLNRVLFTYGNLRTGNEAIVYDNCHFLNTNISGNVKCIKNSSLIDVYFNGDVKSIENCNLQGFKCKKEILSKVKNCYNVPKIVEIFGKGEVTAYGEGEFKVELKTCQYQFFDINKEQSIFDQAGKYVSIFYEENKALFDYLDFEHLPDNYDLEYFANNIGTGE